MLPQAPHSVTDHAGNHPCDPKQPYRVFAVTRRGLAYHTQVFVLALLLLIFSAGCASFGDPLPTFEPTPTIGFIDVADLDVDRAIDSAPVGTLVVTMRGAASMSISNTLFTADYRNTNPPAVAIDYNALSEDRDVAADIVLVFPFDIEPGEYEFTSDNTSERLTIDGLEISAVEVTFGIRELGLASRGATNARGKLVIRETGRQVVGALILTGDLEGQPVTLELVFNQLGVPGVE